MTWLRTEGPIAKQLGRMQEHGKRGVGDGKHSDGQPGRSVRETKGSSPGVLGLALNTGCGLQFLSRPSFRRSSTHHPPPIG